MNVNKHESPKFYFQLITAYDVNPTVSRSYNDVKSICRIDCLHSLSVTEKGISVAAINCSAHEVL